MGKLTKIANTILGAGGEYLPLNDLIAEYPEGVTVNGAYLRQTAKGTVPCFTFAENVNKYFYAVAGDLAHLFNNWLTNCDNDVNELNEELHIENIKLKIQKRRTKSGNMYTKAWVVGTFEKPIVADETPEPVDAVVELENVDQETGEILEDDLGDFDN